MKIRRIKTNNYEEIYASIPNANVLKIREVVEEFQKAHFCRLVRIMVFLHGEQCEPEDLSDYPAMVLRSEQNAGGRPYASLELQAVRSVSPEVEIDYVLDPCGIKRVATVFRSSQETRLLATGLGSPAGSFADQLHAIFGQFEDLLEEHQLQPTDINRTWYFLHGIAHHYDTLNRIRNVFFDKWGVERYPASTGVGGCLLSPQLVTVSFNALKKLNSDVEEINTEFQCPPAQYGSRFSRAHLIRDGDVHLLEVSGISSIDHDGRSVHNGDVSRGIAHAMKSLEDILSRASMTYADIVSAYVYFKDEKVRARFVDYLRSRKLDFPFIFNFASICRPELWFEIEAKAARQLRGVPRVDHELTAGRNYETSRDRG